VHAYARPANQIDTAEKSKANIIIVERKAKILSSPISLSSQHDRQPNPPAAPVLLPPTAPSARPTSGCECLRLSKTGSSDRPTRAPGTPDRGPSSRLCIRRAVGTEHGRGMPWRGPWRRGTKRWVSSSCRNVTLTTGRMVVGSGEREEAERKRGRILTWTQWWNRKGRSCCLLIISPGSLGAPGLG
jgi:hypothetical protein